MAKFFWRGTTDTVWDKGSNWIDDNGDAYPEARFPGSLSDVYDEVYLDAAVTNKVGGKDLVTSGYEDLKLFHVFEAYDQNIGSSGTSLKMNVLEEAMIEGTSAGDFWLNGANGGEGFTRMTVLDFKEGSTLTLAGKAQTLTILKGKVVLHTGMLVPTLFAIRFRSSRTSDAEVEIPDGVSIPTIMQDGGQVTSSGTVSSQLRISDGMWIQNAGNITGLNLRGGQFTWNGGDISDAIINGGVIDGSESDEERSIDGKIYDGTVNLANGSRSISADLEWFGGEILWDPGERFVRIPA